ncbi:hypothetical protein GGTG_13491 [Gaeumannomyces tritici R3-111a-1]|uniref:Uncharacterized protein n=1 Tax=Gaeumannomyces tritici (strain R3-111a-1) TaxID=644352 RepID=J3PJ09_GAET3|nr:hypothetical protein GGTG_13491 [Gaeumannomyces tritici R3-111a-1]EJT68985.1 hypothetical protein GGTG_13491 [Gaeumannomyces tritici R3-111a-1]
MLKERLYNRLQSTGSRRGGSTRRLKDRVTHSRAHGHQAACTVKDRTGDTQQVVRSIQMRAIRFVCTRARLHARSRDPGSVGRLPVRAAGAQSVYMQLREAFRRVPVYGDE